MFKIDSNGNIQMVAGDTGGLSIQSSKTDYGTSDRAIFSVQRSDGTIVLSQIHQLTAGLIDITFYNSTTDTWDPGAYTYQVRYVQNPIYDSAGEIVDGDVVSTGEFGTDGSVTRTINIIKPIKEV